MIKFFRTIRKNLLNEGKTTKYLKYAIGEIVLVIIGILIALQINNWNDGRKEQDRLTNYLIEIQNNLSNDIIRANDIIDNFIGIDSMLRNIKFDKVIYTIEKNIENQQSISFPFEFEIFRLQTKGYDGLVQNIDNVPEQYAELMDALNEIYVTNNNNMITYNQRVISNAYNNKDYLKSKEWSGDFFDWGLNVDMINYFQSNAYKNVARHYFNDLSDYIIYVYNFKIYAIITYNEISKINASNKPIPKHINYTFPEPDTLSLFSGEFQIVSKESTAEGDLDKLYFEVDEGQLYWHYIYKDVNSDDEFNVPLYWHMGQQFFHLAGGSAIWEFEITNESDIIFKIKTDGSMDIYKKITKL